MGVDVLLAADSLVGALSPIASSAAAEAMFLTVSAMVVVLVRKSGGERGKMVLSFESARGATKVGWWGNCAQGSDDKRHRVSLMATVEEANELG